MLVEAEAAEEAIAMSRAEPRGTIRLCLTCDEEIGKGTDHLDIQHLGADWAYTLDGGGTSEIDTATFSADLAEVTVAAWRKASSNPTLELNQVPTVSEVLASPMIASPLTQAMMARPVDGAVVIVLANASVARRVTTEPVWVKGIGAAMDSSVFAMRDGQFDVCRQAAQRAYTRAGLSPAQMDLAETSATSAAAELMTLEALGLAEPGKAIDLFRQGRDASINGSGGALPANPIMATGLVRLSEAALALWAQRGSGAKSSRRAVVHASSGIAAQSHCVFVVEVERP
jgi:acetyl-CoA C-acetyltransferase